jgi:cyclase
MLRTRVIPVLLLKGKGLVKTVKFDKPRYIGDPINTVRIFNEKETDELVFLDIEAGKKGQKPDFELIRNIASECFMPLGYGGGISNLEDISRLFSIGVEKVVINTAALMDLELVAKASGVYGSQSIVVGVDVKKNLWGNYQVYSHSNQNHRRNDLLSYLQEAQAAGAGEIFLNAVDRDGMMQGYDISLIRRVAAVLQVPLLVCGGAGKLADFSEAVSAGASGVAAGSLFVYHGPLKAVLINYPSQKELKSLLS